jgi:hypothetical protein
LLEHLVALVEDEVLDVLGLQDFLASESVQATGGGDDDVRALSLVFEHLRILLDRGAAEEGGDADVGHVLGETRVLVLDLVRELTRVAENDDRHLSIDGLELLQAGQHEHRCLSMTRLGLAQDVHPQDGLGNALLLDYKRYGQCMNKNRICWAVYLRTGVRNRGR